MAAAARGRVLVIGHGDWRARTGLLEEAGFEVVEARSADPVGLLGQGGFDLVLGDLSPPAGDGLTLLDRIREREPELPVVLLSSKARPRLAARAAERGALVCQASGLRRTVERAVRRHRLAGGPAQVVPFRNRRGEEVALLSVSATDAKNEFGRVLDAAMAQGAVAITRHDAAKAVLLSIDEYNALVAGRMSELETLTEEFDALLARQQTPSARKGMRAAFDASPAELGKAALAGARRRG